MKDYAEPLLAIDRNHKVISNLLLKRNFISSVDEINDLIINAIELKQIVTKLHENNK